MISIIFYFQVHQPFRLRKDYNFFDIGKNHFYEDDKANREILNKVAEKNYIPMNKLLLELIKEYPGEFKVSFSISGVALEQFELYNPYVLELFQELAATGQVEFINETYYHSLAFLFSKKEFKEFKVKNSAKAMFPLDYLSDMLKGSGKNLILSMKSDAPIKLDYKINEAELTYFLAPRIESE